jgi:hypothetical protein
VARNVRVVTGQQDELDRARQMADALTVRALKSRTPQQGGPVQVAMNPWEGIAQLGEAFVANRVNANAQKLAQAQHEGQQKANLGMVDQLTRNDTRRLDENGNPTGASMQSVENLDGTPMLSSRGEMLASAMKGGDPKATGAALQGEIFRQAMPQPGEVERVDVGNAVVLIDKATGRELGRMPKAATPDAALGSETSRRGQDIGAQTAVRGQDITARGQDIGAQTAVRGQDMTAQTAVRGQDLTAQTATRGQDMTDARAAATKAPPTNALGFNERQMSGLGMQRNAAITYAANISGKTQEEIERILALEGPDGVARIMNENGERWLQGGGARMLQALPIIGTPILEAFNADLIAPRTAGGAGTALIQNPTGMITTPDFVAGEKQFPGPTYPLKDQANMVRDMLKQGYPQPAAPAQAAAQAPAEGPVQFATEQEAEAAGIPPGTKVVIGGVPGTWH